MSFFRKQITPKIKWGNWFSQYKNGMFLNEKQNSSGWMLIVHINALQCLFDVFTLSASNGRESAVNRNIDPLKNIKIVLSQNTDEYL